MSYGSYLRLIQYAIIIITDRQISSKDRLNMNDIQLTSSEFVALYGLASVGMLSIILCIGHYIMRVYQRIREYHKQ